MKPQISATDYLNKCKDICERYEPKGCHDCPLREYACGVPLEQDEIQKVIEIVENYKCEPTPLKACPKCSEELCNELVASYKFCPYCGWQLG